MESEIKDLQEKNIIPDLLKLTVAISVAKAIERISENKDNKDNNIIKKSKEEIPDFCLIRKRHNCG